MTETMRIAIQQPEHLPWMGFFNKMAQCDLFVYLDNVQFKKRYFENRNRVLGPDGPLWLTVPVVSKGRYTQLIHDVAIAPEPGWQRKYAGRLEHCLGRTGYWDQAKALVQECLDAKHALLADLNICLVQGLARVLGINTETVRASKLESFQCTGSELILEICRHTGAREYISGPDGRNYLDLDRFEKAGVAVLFHDYVHPTYDQGREFVSHLSTLDLVARLGPAAGPLVRKAYAVPKDA